MARVFFDITDIATYIRFHSSITGIQRATVTTIAHALRQRGPGRVWLAWHSSASSAYHCCPADGLDAALEGFDIATLGRVLGVQVARPAPPVPFLDRYAASPLKRRFHMARLDLAWRLGQRRVFDKRGVDFDAWSAWRAPRPAVQAARAGFFDTARPGDVLCGLGLLWGRPQLEESFAQARAAGIAVHVMVYDLVPMKLPDLVDPRFSTSYYDWLSQTPSYVSGYMACSRSTAADLAAFLAPLNADQPVRTVPLAQARLLPPGAPQTGHEGPPEHEAALARTRAAARLGLAVREAASLPYVLCVGTIEPRKNLWRLAQAWARLAREPGLDLPRLVLAGKRGWLTDGFLDMLERSGGLGGWVIHLDAPADHELDYLYRNCLFTATVSLYEGWGLPIGESLAYGKTGVVSKAASMPEVGGEMVRYCDPGSIDDIAAACCELVAQPGRRAALEARIAAARLRGWQDVARDVLAALEAGSPS